MLMCFIFIFYFRINIDKIIIIYRNKYNSIYKEQLTIVTDYNKKLDCSIVLYDLQNKELILQKM